MKTICHCLTVTWPPQCTTPFKHCVPSFSLRSRLIQDKMFSNDSSAMNFSNFSITVSLNMGNMLHGYLKTLATQMRSCYTINVCKHFNVWIKFLPSRYPHSTFLRQNYLWCHDLCLWWPDHSVTMKILSSFWWTLMIMIVSVAKHCLALKRPVPSRSATNCQDWSLQGWKFRTDFYIETLSVHW